MPNGMYGGVRGRKTKVGRKLLLFSSYSICLKYADIIDCNRIDSRADYFSLGVTNAV